MEVYHIIVVRLVDNGVEQLYLVTGAGDVDNLADAGKPLRQPATRRVGVENPEPFGIAQKQRIGIKARKQRLAVARLIR